MKGCKFCADIDEPGLYKPYQPCKTVKGKRCDACFKIKQLEYQIAEAKKAVDKLFEQHLADGQYPLIFGAVCRSWRQIAWSTPSLWSSIEIDAERHYHPTCREVAGKWLNRSAQLPLMIRLCAPPTFDWYRKRKNEEGLCELFDIINQHSNRWKTLNVEIIGTFFDHLWEDSQPGSVLRTLRLRSTGSSFPPPGVRFQGTKPRPENVALSSFYFRDVEIGWDNVTSAELLWLHVEDFLELLKQAPKLHICTLLINCIPRMDAHFPIPSDAIVHDQLSEFTYKFAHVSNYDEALDTFFDKTSFPGLTRFAWEPLRPESKYHIPELPARSMLSFFQHSCCLLKELVISETRLIDDEIIPILTELLSLEKLDLSPSYIDLYVPDNLFRLMGETAVENDRNKAERLLPELQSFKYTHGSPATQLAWEHIPAMFGPLCEVELPSLRPLKTVEIRVAKKDSPSFTYIDEETIGRIHAILETGVDLEIRDKDTNSDLVQASVVQHESIARKSTRRCPKR
ncbi:hypothetical protein CPB84DRAFT_1767572 [Gymnopilus junonius]|uniref:F-box domain-containing protein n=1 Tax=Gymnopilus junonius TaxID=109634 RepID=A0A9P5NX54_GYMJU|nr:hypothetical protein CPB84DRAFT_1767572 [Gymnopilus junonius]